MTINYLDDFKVGFGPIFAAPQPRHITDGDLAALIPPDAPREGKHKADKFQWRIERYEQPAGVMTTSVGDDDYTFNAMGNAVKTTWKVYLGKHCVSRQRKLDGVRTYLQHADKREAYDRYMVAKEKRKQERREQAKRDRYLRTRTEAQEWADSWAENGDYYGSTAKGELEQLIADAPDDFDTAVLTAALSSIEEAINAYHKAQR